MNVKYTKQLVTSIIVAGFLMRVLFTSNDLLTKVIVIPFLTFAVALGIKNVFVMMNKNALAAKVGKVCTVAFMVYWFGFLIYWDYVSWIARNYVQIAFSVPFWVAGVYFAYKRLWKK